MNDAVILDSTPLGILSHPRTPPHVLSCRQWLTDLLSAGRRVVVPEIADYEVRRELIRLGNNVSLTNLDTLESRLEYVPINSVAMRLAAGIWARARGAGLPTASHTALDGDVILAAQALNLNISVVVATANPAHMSRFVNAELWSKIVL